MKPHERRAAGQYPYFKLARWSESLQTFMDTKPAHPDVLQAMYAASNLGSGKYRISRVTEDERTDADPFEID
jgi:hypothetical protein